MLSGIASSSARLRRSLARSAWTLRSLTSASARRREDVVEQLGLARGAPDRGRRRRAARPRTSSGVTASVARTRPARSTVRPSASTIAAALVVAHEQPERRVVERAAERGLRLLERRRLAASPAGAAPRRPREPRAQQPGEEEERHRDEGDDPDACRRRSPTLVTGSSAKPQPDEQHAREPADVDGREHAPRRARSTRASAARGTTAAATMNATPTRFQKISERVRGRVAVDDEERVRRALRRSRRSGSRRRAGSSGSRAARRDTRRRRCSRSPLALEAPVREREEQVDEDGERERADRHPERERDRASSRRRARRGTTRSRRRPSAARCALSRPPRPAEEPGADERPAEQQAEDAVDADDVRLVVARQHERERDPPAARPTGRRASQGRRAAASLEQRRQRRPRELGLRDESAGAAALDERGRTPTRRGSRSARRRARLPFEVSRAATSNPSMSGSCTSSRTTSGRSRRAASIALAPSSASPTTRIPPPRAALAP